jgi:hypothetical protein
MAQLRQTDEFKQLEEASDGVGLRSLGHFATASRGGSRPRELNFPWPNGYQKWTAQLASNALCLQLQKIVTKKTGREWELREIEGVLFMDGY